MITVSQIQENIFVARENVNIPYSADTLAMNREIRRYPEPFSALKQGKFRKLFNRHRPTLGYR